MTLMPGALGGMADRVQTERDALGRTGRFDVAVFGRSESAAAVQAFADAGATWWLESLSPMRGSLDQQLALVQAGPPRAG